MFFISIIEKKAPVQMTIIDNISDIFILFSVAIRTVFKKSSVKDIVNA